jgi:nucleoside-diphosphate kinase
MPIERTLVLVKPHAVFNGLAARIAERYAAAGFTVVDSFYFPISTDRARAFYVEHAGKFFFEDLVLAMSSHIAMAIILEGEDAVARVRKLNGATDPAKADPGTIRADFRTSGGPFNTVHGSANVADAAREIALVLRWKR